MKQPSLRAGAGKAAIQLPPGFLPWENFTGVQDALYARAILLESGQRVLLVSLELTSLPGGECDELRARLAQATGVPDENIWICVTHTFSAPHLLPKEALATSALQAKREGLKKAIQAAALAAAGQALQALQPAAIGTGLGCCMANVNRDVETPEGWWLGQDPHGLSDKSVTVVRLDDETGQPIAVLYHYSVQSSVADDALDANGHKLVSGDLAGRASRFIEEALGTDVAMFLMGAAGDQAPAQRVYHHEDDAPHKAVICIERLGGMLGDEVVHVAKKLLCNAPGQPMQAMTQTLSCPAQVMPPDIHMLKPSKTYKYIPASERDTGISVIQYGDIALVGVQPELNCFTATQIKAASPYRYTLPVTMVNGAAKYMADEDSYTHYTYEAMNSPFARGSAELLRDKATEMLRALADANAEPAAKPEPEPDKAGAQHAV